MGLGSVLVIIFLHFLVMGLCAKIFFENNNDSNRRKIFKKTFPIFSKLWVIIAVFIVFGPLLYYNIKPIDEVDDFIGFKAIIFIIIYSIVIMRYLYRLINKELKNADNSPFLGGINKVKPAILCYIYCSSIVLGSIVTHLTNYGFYWFVRGKEYIVMVTRTQHSEVSDTNFYRIYFSPDIYGLRQLEVSKRFFYKVREGDKLKLYLKNGFCGIRYISSTKEVIEKGSSIYNSYELTSENENKEKNTENKDKLDIKVPKLAGTAENNK